MKLIKYSHILLMKSGPYCDLSLDEIIDIKQKEEKKVGKFFWGYSGVFCRPHVIKNLVQYSKGKKYMSYLLKLNQSLHQIHILNLINIQQTVINGNYYPKMYYC